MSRRIEKRETTGLLHSTDHPQIFKRAVACEHSGLPYPIAARLGLAQANTWRIERKGRIEPKGRIELRGRIEPKGRHEPIRDT